MAGVQIDATLVGRLIAVQFPRWASLAIRPVTTQGRDNRTFRLGEHMAARLPSAAPYVAQVEKEQAWLPRLAPRLPLPIPQPVALGAPGQGYAWPWSIYRWLEGEAASTAAVADLPRFARDLAAFLVALQKIDAAEGSPAGAHSFWRGGPLATYDAETRQAIAALGDRINGAAATPVWDAALAAPWRGPPAWFHGDIAAGNLLTADGRLAAVIDFGCCGVGDPACDLAIAWTLFEGESREAFRAALPLDDGAWRRGRGWALWKALITLAALPGANAAKAAKSARIIEAVIVEYRAGNRP